MKKTTFWLFAFCFCVFSWQSNAQFSCETAVELSNGYSETGITTDGTQNWASAPEDSCTLTWRYWGDDDYLFTYTAATAESIQINFQVNSDAMLSGIFTTCDGEKLSGCLNSDYGQKDGSIVLEAVLEKDQTVYVLVSEFAGVTGGLNFDVTSFTATEITCPVPTNLQFVEIGLETATISWDAGSDETAWTYVVQEASTEGTPTGTEQETTDNPVSISGLTSGTDYEFFLKANCATDDASEWVGPFSFMTEISCPVPTNIALTDATLDSATLSWDSGSDEMDWTYVVQEKGPGQPITPEISTQDNPLTIDGLNAGTEYEFYLEANCEEDDASEWVGPFYFATECDAVSEFFEDFESGTGREFPVCWSKVGEGGDAYGQTSPVVEGSRNLYMKSYSETNRALVALPEVNNANLETHQIKLKYKAIVPAQAGQTLEVGYLTDVMDETSFVMISSVVATSTTVQELVVIPKDMPSSNATFAFRTGVLNKNLVIDDVSWELAPTCPAPGGLNITDIGANTATLNWTENGSASVWDVEYGAQGFTPTGTPTNEGITEMFYVLDDLDASSDYDFYVRSNCGDGDASTWVGPISFTTLCPVLDMYAQDFVNASPHDLEGMPVECWTEGENTAIAEGPNGENGNWRAAGLLGDGNTGTLSYEFYNAVNSTDWLVSPTFDLSSEDRGLALMLALANSTDNSEDTMQEGDEVQLLISEDDGVTWANVYTWTAENQPTAELSELIIDLSSYSSATTKLAFWANNGDAVDTKAYKFYIDSFVVDTYSTLSVSQQEVDNQFTYYPNPVNHTLTLKSKFQIETVEVYNVVGQSIKRIAPNSVKSELDLSGLPAGPYFVKVRTNGLTKTVRVIKN